MGINWEVRREEDDLLLSIAQRAAKDLGVQDTTTWYMDVTACHANGCPLRLKDLLDAPAGTFNHDMLGIRKAINRKTGKLTEDCFVPRLAQ